MSSVRMLGRAGAREAVRSDSPPSPFGTLHAKRYAGEINCFAP